MNYSRITNVGYFLMKTNLLKIVNTRCQFSMVHVLRKSDIGNKNISFDQIRILVNNLDGKQKNELMGDLQKLHSKEKIKVAEDEQAQAKHPAASELRQVALLSALPFVGFGFLDNVIMIVAGEYIDANIGTYLGISTLAAAALGNTISDLAGIGSAWYVENIAAKIGIRSPNLTPAQLDSSSARWFSNIGRCIGVVLGCLLGMFPLFFLPLHSKSDKPKR